MTSYAKQITRRAFILSLMTLAMFKRLYGKPDKSGLKTGKDETVLAGRWLLKKSDLS